MLRGSERNACADVHGALNDLDLDERGDRRSRCDFPDRARPRYGCVVEFEVKKRIKKFTPRPRSAGRHVAKDQADVDRVQEFRKASSAFSAMMSVTCCAITTSTTSSSVALPVHVAALEMHPLDTENRVGELKEAHGIGY